MKISDCIKRPHVLVEVNLTSIGNITELDEANDSVDTPVSSSSEVFFHRPPPARSLNVSGEEIGIVTIVLLLWIAAIALFINRWGKIRLMEPYHPYIRPESNNPEDRNSEDVPGEGSHRLSTTHPSMDYGVVPLRRKSIFPGPVTLEIPSTSPRSSLSGIDRRKSVLDLWPGQSAASLRQLTERRRSCLSDFSSHGTSHNKLSSLSVQYNSNRSVSLHPYFYLNSKTPPMLRYTPASTEKSDDSPILLSEKKESNDGDPKDDEFVQVHDEASNHSEGSFELPPSSSAPSFKNSPGMTRQFSINMGSFDNSELAGESSIEISISETTRSARVSDV